VTEQVSTCKVAEIVCLSGELMVLLRGNWKRLSKTGSYAVKAGWCDCHTT